MKPSSIRAAAPRRHASLSREESLRRELGKLQVVVYGLPPASDGLQLRALVRERLGDTGIPGFGRSISKIFPLGKGSTVCCMQFTNTDIRDAFLKRRHVVKEQTGLAVTPYYTLEQQSARRKLEPLRRELRSAGLDAHFHYDRLYTTGDRRQLVPHGLAEASASHSGAHTAEPRLAECVPCSDAPTDDDSHMSEDTDYESELPEQCHVSAAPCTPAHEAAPQPDAAPKLPDNLQPSPSGSDAEISDAYSKYSKRWAQVHGELVYRVRRLLKLWSNDSAPAAFGAAWQCFQHDLAIATGKLLAACDIRLSWEDCSLSTVVQSAIMLARGELLPDEQWRAAIMRG